MKMMQGAFFLACSNMSRTRLAPTPTNISTKSEPEMEKKGTPASPATARASSVLPVPGGPTRRAPLGILPPSFWNLPGSFRNSTISCSSSLASSTPATSSNVTRVLFSVSSLAFDLPKPMAPRPAPFMAWRMKKNHSAPRRMKGSSAPRSCIHGDGWVDCAWMLTPLASNRFRMSAEPPGGSTTVKRRFSLSSTMACSPRTTAFTICFWSVLACSWL